MTLLFHSIQLGFGMVHASPYYPPVGTARVVQRVILAPNDPFVVLEAEALATAPTLQYILDNATYWARANLNETYHWIIGNATYYQIKATLDQAYISKYGMTAFEYGQTHNVTFKVPVVSYAEFNFTISQPLGILLIVQREYLGEGDPRLEWNGSILESIAPLKHVLDVAVAWTQYHVYALFYYLDSLETRETIFAGFRDANEAKYGMQNWYQVALAHNSTQLDPVVAYAGYYFSFSFALPENPPSSSLWLILVIGAAAAAGLVLLTVTLFNWRRLRLELTRNGRTETTTLRAGRAGSAAAFCHET